jgi:putative nucleotidyltransferase with HDIG domain
VSKKLNLHRFRFAKLTTESRPAKNRTFWSAIHVGDSLSLKRILLILLLVVLVLIPNIFGPKLVPYRLGQSLRHSIYARQSFSWENKAGVEQVKKQLTAEFPRYYKEDSQWVWNTFDPIYNMLNKAYSLARNGDFTVDAAAVDLIKFSVEQKVSISEAEGKIVIEEFRKQRLRMNLYEDIIKPSQSKILKNEFFDTGILAKDDFRKERQRRIKIVSTWWEEDSDEVGSSLGPISISDVPRRLKNSFDREFQFFSSKFRRAYASVVARNLKPSLHYDKIRSEKEFAAALHKETLAVRQVEQGDLLMTAGKSISANDLMRIRAEIGEFEKGQGSAAAVIKILGMGALLFTGAVGFLLYIIRFEVNVFNKVRELLMVLAVAVIFMWVIQICMVYGITMTLVPVGIISGITALIFGPRVGVGTASLLAYSSFVITRIDIGEVMALLGSSWVFCCLAPGVRDRSGILRAAVVAGGVNFLAESFWRISSGGISAYYFSERGGWDFAFWIGALDGVAWVAGGILFTVFLPFIERFFSTATNVTLLELSDQEHPCLRQLLLEAPGTYHHSVVVGNLAETAAEVVGANSLLARVGSYYHDIGKMVKPEYFTENDSGKNRHDNLSPTISSLIITAHVKDGVEIAASYDLPRDIVDIIEQHHGDTMVGFFYQKLKEQSGDDFSVSEDAFRYPGPRPAKRETAIVLMADSVEAASRSLKEPSPARIRSLVHKIIMEKLTSGQLDRSPLSFRDVSAIEDSFVRTLIAMFHSRIRYPDSKSS